jgi:adenine-specific DNA-methyltransferase
LKIYIDPPYNTGNDFVYEDDFKDGVKNYLEVTGQLDSEGKKIGTNSSSAGRYHTNWLNMMYPRLKLARNLLKDDGVIFISIDDVEQDNLKKLCNEIFGEENALGQIIWHNSSRASDLVAIEHEYLLVYAKNISSIKTWKKERVEASLIKSKVEQIKLDGGTIELAESILKKEIENYQNIDKKNKTRLYSWLTNYSSIDEDWNIYYAVDLTGEGSGPDRKFGDKVIPAPAGRHWMGQDYIDELFEQNRIVWRNDRAYRKLYIDESLENLKSIITIPTRQGSESLKSLLGKDVFDKPKPINLIKHIAKYIVNDNDIVLDFFAGSGTTPHAIIKLNAETNKKTTFIAVQLPEVLDESKKEHKAPIAFCKDNDLKFNISEISKERIRRAGKKIKEENPLFSGDLGFKVFKLDTSNIKMWEAGFDTLKDDLLNAVDYIKQDRSSDDVLFELLIKYGLDLTVPIEARTIAGKTVYSIGLGALVVCLDKDVSMDVVNGIGALKEELKPEIMRVVFKDNGFKDDVVKTNALQTLKRFGIEDIKSL